MAKKYGQTWWGQQWLNALSNIDYDNRLPRGRSYATKGAIVSIKIVKNSITAKVQGTRPSPYKIDIRVPEFNQKEQDKLTSIMLSNKMLLSRLLNRQLPSSLLQYTENENIQVFPRSWRDIDMKCSCPDWAVPCKHLAAVIYQVASEIDENPFLVFQLHDFDIPKILAKKGLDLSDHNEEHIIRTEDMFSEKTRNHDKNDKEEVEKTLPDYSQTPDLKGFLPTLLTSSPLFYEKDFRTIIEKALGKLSRFAAKYENESAVFANPIPGNTARMELISDIPKYAAKVLIADHEKPHYKPTLLNEFLSLTTHLEKENRLHLFHPSFMLLYDILQFIKVLFRQSAIIPQQFIPAKETYAIRWIPARMDATVREQCNFFEQKLDNDLLPFSFIPEAMTGDKKLNGVEQLNLICNTMANQFFALSFDLRPHTTNDFPDGHPLLSFFFRHSDIQFPLELKNVPDLIQIWLRRLEINTRQVVPVIRVDEDDFQFHVGIDVSLKEKGEIISLLDFLKNQSLEEHHIPLLKDLAQLSDYFPDIETIVQNNNLLSYYHNQFESILLEILPLIRLLGISIALPSSLKRLIRPVAGIKMQESSRSTSEKHLSITDLLSYQWSVSIGDNMIDKDAFFELVGNRRGLVKLRDNYLIITDEDILKLHKQLNKQEELTPAEMLRAALAEDHNNAPVLISDAVKQQIKKMLTPDSINIPPSIKANLRPYQFTGFRWLAGNSKLGLGSLIADDMGLGKTVQVITVLQHFKDTKKINNSNKALVVAPTSLLSNWKKEVEKFAPGLKVEIYHGTQRKLPEHAYDVLLTSYGLIRNDHNILSKVKYYAMIIDESQAIKNPAAEQTKAIKKIKASVKIAMSGTPVENKLLDYWSVFDFINKGYLGNRKAFETYFAKPIQKEHDRRKTGIFRRATGPFLLRRLKTDKSIISDLPDKIENTLFCNLTPQQAATYQNVVNNTMEVIEQSEGIQRKGMILKLMTALKQICNHPAQYLKEGKSDADESGKAQLLLSLLGNILENNEKTLIFTQYKQMGELLSDIIYTHTGITPLFLHGQLTRKKRDEMVDAFQKEPNQKIFILSLKAGGTGLNLTAANNVIHYDLWWNPAVEAQATDRAFRIGQKKNVMVYRPLCKGTMEEKIDKMIKSKKELANLAVGSGESWIGDLSNKQLKELVELKVD